MIKCESCDSATVNGVYVHEAGCPDMWKNEIRECGWCGQEFKPKYKIDFHCSGQCYADRWG